VTPPQNLNPAWVQAAPQAAAGDGNALCSVHTVAFGLHGLPTPHTHVRQVRGAAAAGLAKMAPTAVVASPAPKIFSAWRREVAFAIPLDTRSSVSLISEDPLRLGRFHLQEEAPTFRGAA
jgi:hypothetical protein